MILRRNRFWSETIVLTLVLALIALEAFAISPEVRRYLHYETQANAAAKRSTEMVEIKHFEIPMSVVDTDISNRFPKEVMDSLVFEKNGVKTLRWIINPEDTKWKEEVKIYLQSKGLSTQEHKFFQGYQTASRSYVLENPETGATFSAKVSTDKTGGRWTDKKQTKADSFETRIATDYIQRRNQITPFEHFKMLDEPGAFGLTEIDQGMMIRSLHELPKGEFNYLPGFSAMHSEVGRHIANLNGFDDPLEFWNTHYNKPLARSLAELAAKTGVAYDSPHSQNFLIELDKNFRPTGKLILKDMGDIFLNSEMVTALGGEKLVSVFPAENKRNHLINAYVGIMHGNEFPDWMTDADYTNWGKDFSKEFDRELAEQSGVNIEKFQGPFYQQGRYFGKGISTDSPEWQKHIAELADKVSPAQRRMQSAISGQGDGFCSTAYKFLGPTISP
jgi:hypothetical protein